MQETIHLNADIEARNPDLYKFLEETPMLLFDKNGTEVYITDFGKYLQILKEQMMSH